VRLAGVSQIAEVILTGEADGSQTNRFVRGSNAGMKVMHRFEPDGPDATIAEVTIQLPVRGLRKLLAPLVGLTLRRKLVRGLQGDRRDLEEHGYPAPVVDG